MQVNCQGCQVLQEQVAKLSRQVEELTQQLEEARRAGKRQAAPFSKGPPKPAPKRPGRKPGSAYGTKGHRPAPEKIDEVLEAPLPHACPDCGGVLEETQVTPQYQVEIPRKPIHRQFNVHIGQCCDCRRRVQGRHPLQTSDALGAAASQLGPDAQAAIVELNKQGGMSHGKVTRCLESLFGIELTRGGSVHTVLRAGRRCQPVYQDIRQRVAAADSVVLDETGWRVGGRPAWLHTLVTPQATAYVIDPSRGRRAAEDVLGLDYDGRMVHDGWSPYNAFVDATHQQCLRHLLNRCDELLEQAVGGAVRFPRRVDELLHQALELRDRHLAGHISDHGLRVARGRLQHVMEDLIFPLKTNPANDCFAAHLWQHRKELFTFLDFPGLDATNWRAELAIRFGVILRKVWGGSRTWVGARTQGILMSVWRTCWQQARNAVDYVSQVLRGHIVPLALPS
jgi:transposase